MTREEAIKIFKIVQFADGGCSHCVTPLMDAIEHEFPGIDWRAIAAEHAHEDAGEWHEPGQRPW